MIDEYEYEMEKWQKNKDAEPVDEEELKKARGLKVAKLD